MIHLSKITRRLYAEFMRASLLHPDLCKYHAELLFACRHAEAFSLVYASTHVQTFLQGSSPLQQYNSTILLNCLQEKPAAGMEL